MNWKEAREKILSDPDVRQECVMLYYEECCNNVRWDILVQVFQKFDMLQRYGKGMWF